MKPCPWCKAKTHVGHTKSGSGRWWVECPTHDNHLCPVLVSTFPHPTKKAAVAAWESMA